MPPHHEASQLEQPGASEPTQQASFPSHSPQSSARKRSQPLRSTRRPVRYTEYVDVDYLDDDREGERGEFQTWQSTDSEAEEDARIERSMGVIRKNAASRGSEGGTKYHCDV